MKGIVGELTWDEKWAYTLQEGTEGIVKGRVRCHRDLGRFFSGQELQEYRYKCSSQQWHWYYASMLRSLNGLPTMNEGVFFPVKKGVICVH